MANVQEAARALAKACRSVDLDGEFYAATAEDLAEAEGQLPLNADLRAWYQCQAPRDVAIPFDVLDLTLSDPAALTEWQGGYRWDTRTGESLTGWPDQWLVIGSVEGDPVIAHTDRAGTPIAMAEHGTGAWAPYLVAPDLATYLAALAVWAEVAVGEFNGRVRSDDWDSRLLPEARAKLDHRLSPLLADEYRQQWLPRD